MSCAIARRTQHSAPGSCPCGTSRFKVHGRLLARFFCHCTICQALYKAPYADVTAFRGNAISLCTPGTVRFKRYRRPPALQRGTCAGCDSPVVAFLSLAPFVRLALVPARNLDAASPLAAPAAHIFYDRRIADVPDALPKHFGYWRSELAVTMLVLRGLA